MVKDVPDLLVHCGAIIDVEVEDMLEERTLRIRRGKIEEILQGFDSPADGEQVLDWSEFWVCPGFFDCHNHPTVNIGEPPDPAEYRTVLQTLRAGNNLKTYLQFHFESS